MKKILEQSTTSINVRKSNFTKAMETLGLDEVAIKKTVEEAKEKLIQEQRRLEQQVSKSGEKLEDNNA